MKRWSRATLEAVVGVGAGREDPQVGQQEGGHQVHSPSLTRGGHRGLGSSWRKGSHPALGGVSQTAEQEGLGGARWTSAWRGAAGEAGQGPGLLCALLLCDGETAQRSLPLRHRNGLTARHTPFSAPMSPSCCGVDRVSKRKACNSGRLWAVEALTLPEAPPCCPLSSLVGISNVWGGTGRRKERQG